MRYPTIRNRPAYIAEITSEMRKTAKKKNGVDSLIILLSEFESDLADEEAKREKYKNPEYREALGIRDDNDRFVVSTLDDIDVTKTHIAALKKVISESRK